MIIKVNGLSDLQRYLSEFTPKIERNILRGAIRAAVKPIRDAAVSLAPVEEPSSEGKRLYKLRRGALQRSIRISVKARNGKVSARVVAGGKNKKTGEDVFYAHIVEYTGARAHTITAKGRKALSFGGRLFQSVRHPGVSPHGAKGKGAHSFLRPAYDAQMSNGLNAFRAYIANRLRSKYGLDIPDFDRGD